MHLPTILAVTSITFLFVADVKCGLYEINKNKRANATHGPSPVQKMFCNRTEAMLDQRGPGPGPEPILTLITTTIIRTHHSKKESKKRIPQRARSAEKLAAVESSTVKHMSYTHTAG